MSDGNGGAAIVAACVEGARRGAVSCEAVAKDPTLGGGSDPFIDLFHLFGCEDFAIFEEEAFAFAFGADLVGGALVTAFTAVFIIGLEVDALVIADALSAGADEFALTFDADAFSLALVTAFTAILGIFLKIDAFIVADVEALLAGEGAFSFFADVAAFAGIAAFTAIIAIDLGIGAGVTALGEWGWALQLAFSVDAG